MEKKINTYKIFGDLIWNYISVAISAICGAAFSVVISIFYPEYILGRFNTIYSFYIILSQFCVCGIHMAVIRYTAGHSDKEDRNKILSEALVLTAVISGIVSLLGYLIVNHILYGILGKNWIHAFNYIWVSLVLFAINKVFLGWLNGCSRMKEYAFFQCLRNILIFIALLLFSIAKISGDYLVLSFLFAEGILIILEIFYIIYSKCFHFVFAGKYTKDLFNFGIMILPSNAVLELNTKIDVICMAFILTNENSVGIYSFAAMFAEGFYQIFIVIRRIINPQITAKHIAGELNNYIEIIRNKYIKKVYILSIGAGLLLCIGFQILVNMIGKSNYLEGLIPLFILVFFIVLNAKSVIYGNILAQIGYPAEESILNIITTTFNGFANILLINFFGMTGAAIATGISYCIYNLLQKVFIWKKIRICI